MKCYTLTLLDFPNVDGGAWGALLKGVLLIEHSLPAANGERPCVAYFAGDPQQAVKRYSSFNALHQDLRERLRDKTYQAFARRYVHLRTQPAFFQALEDRLNPLDPVSGHRKPAPNASLKLEKNPLGDNSFSEFCVLQTVKKLDDARVTAVSTDEEDKKTRAARLHSLLNWTVNLLFLVPGLGEAMLAVAGAQLLVQLYNGIEEWRHDEKMQAVLGFIGVLLNVELLGAGAVLARNVEGASFVSRSSLPTASPPCGNPTLRLTNTHCPTRHSSSAMPAACFTTRTTPTWSSTVAITGCAPAPAATATTCNTRKTPTPMARWSITTARAPGAMSSNSPCSGNNRNCFHGWDRMQPAWSRRRRKKSCN